MKNSKKARVNKFTRILTLALLLTVLIVSAAACGKKETDDKKLTIAASVTPHAEILRVAAEELEKDGYEVEIKEFTDYILPNKVTTDGDVDANFFQHVSYLNDYNAKNGTDLVSVAGIHYEPLCLYGGQTASLSELKDGATVAVPNDPSNEARALMVLEQEGLIKLREGAGLAATILDIEENPRNLDIKELAAEQLPRSLEDVDFAVINGNFALQSGLSPEDALAVETLSGETLELYQNVLAVREDKANDPAILALRDALKSDTVKDYINETWKGAVVPLD
ncbi:MAG: MetQ/NlpA family ABC transporter substrate-binding protein [Eubacteriales bacterium]|nr:MetQ/NlpA family ABC transporter substrate-binding protein [Eubacteriales bacterium]